MFRTPAREIVEKPRSVRHRGVVLSDVCTAVAVCALQHRGSSQGAISAAHCAGTARESLGDLALAEAGLLEREAGNSTWIGFGEIRRNAFGYCVLRCS
jgi:hypothetical protein